MRPPEDRLFEQYRRRHDARLFAEVFDRTAPALLRIARRIAPRRDLADDVLQQTFLAALESADRWEPERGLFPWLVGILVRQARLLHRQEGRELLPERLGHAPHPPQPAEAAECRELEQEIAEAVAELGDTYRPVLHLHLFHGLNAKEIAAALDRPAGSVRTQLVRGLERLRGALPVGLAGALTLAPPALAQVRDRVLRHAAAGPTAMSTAGLSTPLLLLGGSTMKKWWLAAAALLLVALTTTILLPPGDPAAAIPDSTRLTAKAADRDIGSPASPRIVAEGPNVTIGPPAPPDRQALSPRPATLRVLVLAAGSSGKERPLPGVWVYLQDNRSRRHDEPELGGRTDEDGRVQLDGVPTRPWKVTAMTGAEDARQWVTPEPGTVHDVVLRSRSARFVTVEVVDSTGRPVVDAEVWAGIQIGGPRPPLRTSTRRGGLTDSTGRAQVAVGRGEVVSARKPGYAASPAVPVDLERSPAQSESVISLTMGTGPATLSGSLVFDDGAPASGATVRVFPATPPEARVVAPRRGADGRRTLPPLAVLRRVDDQGRFSIRGLLPGTYQVWTDASTLLYEGELVTLAAGESREVRLELPRRAYVTGRVVRPDGTPATGVFLGIRRPSDQRTVLSDVIDPEGRFTFTVPAGRMRLEAWRRAGEPLLVTEAWASLDPKPLELTVHDPLAVAGRLLREDGTPVADWLVGALAHGVPVNQGTVSEALVSGRFARTPANGSFTVHGAGKGPFTVFASPVRRAVTGPAPLTQENVAAGTSGIEWTVPTRLLEASTVRVRLVGAQGAQTKGMEALLHAGGETFELQRRDGAFVHESLVQSDYVLEARAPGHASRALPFTLETNSLDLGTLELGASVPLHVTPRRLNGQSWQAPLPQPIVHDPRTGQALTPQPLGRQAADGTLWLDGLAPGQYELRPSPNDDLLADPLPFTLERGSAQRLDWPVRVGRALTLRFTTDVPIGTDERLQITLRAAGEALSNHSVRAANATTFVWRHEFAPGRYTVEAARGSGQRWSWPLDTARWPNGGVVDVPGPR